MLNEFGRKITKIADRVQDPKIANRLRSLAKKYGMISVRDNAEQKIKELLEKAIQRYYDIILAPEDSAKDHWVQELKKQLVNLEKVNVNKHWSRGFIFYGSQLDDLVSEYNDSGFDMACGHLNEYKLSSDDPEVRKFYKADLKLIDLYTLVGRTPKNYTTKYQE